MNERGKESKGRRRRFLRLIQRGRRRRKEGGRRGRRRGGKEGRCFGV